MTSTIDTTLLCDKPKSCIYCGGEGPFTDEHIFCAGLGGDDGQFTLHDLVCGRCNTDRFSRMEAEFMRDSPESFARILLQPRGRKRKKGDTTPKFRPSSVRTFLPDGTVVEAAMKPRGEVIILPQFSLVDNTLEGQCGLKADLTVFMDQLSSLLNLDTVPVITKGTTSGRTQYSIVSFRWTGERYVVDGRAMKLKVPTQCFWRDTEAETDPRDSRSRIFRRAEGQIIIRLKPPISDAEFLTLLRKNVGGMLAASDQAGPGAPVCGALVSLSMQTQVGLRERILAKIGVNLSVRVFGEEYMRHRCFDDIKASILTGEPEVFSTLHQLDQIAPGDVLVRLFAAAPPKHHLCILTALNVPNEGIQLIFCIRLYGGTVTILKLGQDIPTSLPLPTLPVFLFVDYVNHRIQLTDTAEFTTHYMFPNLARDRSITGRRASPVESPVESASEGMSNKYAPG